jgi:clan AA aspartic protease (TIGR02281 family)
MSALRLFEIRSAPQTDFRARTRTSCHQLHAYEGLGVRRRRLSRYIKLRPDDTRAIANYGFVLNWEGKDRAAVAQFQNAIDQGEGTYDLFAAYADSLAKIGRIDDAIDWSYKTLQLVPSLVDVRGKLARLLVRKKRYYEALTLLAEFDQHLESNGYAPYFKGQRISIESIVPSKSQVASTEAAHLRLVKFNDRFFAPIRIGESSTKAFLVDTGASTVALNDDFLVASKARYKIIEVHAQAKTADGRIVDAKLIVIDHIDVGEFELDDVPAMVCATCSLLLGENALAHFNMTATQVQGVDVLILSPRRTLENQAENNALVRSSANAKEK